MAAILLIIGASGAFNQVLMDSGIGDAIKEILTEWHINPLILAWCVAAVMRFAVGGATRRVPIVLNYVNGLSFDPVE